MECTTKPYWRMTNSIRAFNRQTGHPHRRSSLGVEQLILSIFVHLAPLPHVYRHPALYGSAPEVTTSLLRCSDASQSRPAAASSAAAVGTPPVRPPALPGVPAPPGGPPCRTPR